MQTSDAASVATASKPHSGGRGIRPRSSGARATLLALAAGVALALAFPEPDVAVLAWVAPVPLLLVSGGARPARAFFVGAVFGIGFFGVLLAWISIIGWVAWVLLVGLQAAFVGVFAAAWSIAGRRASSLGRVVLPPLLWVAVEYARSVLPLGGFTWGQLAQSQHDATWLLRLASVGGGWLVSFAVVLGSACLAEASRVLVRGAGRRALGLVVAAAAIAAAPLALPAPEATGERLRIAIVQGSVPEDFAGSLFDKEIAIIRSHERLTRRLAPERPDLVIWPESSVGLDLENVPEVGAAVARSARAVGAPMIVGGNLDAGPGRYLVMAFQVSASGEVVDRYQKTHLVPFGEYVPGRDLLGWVPMLDQVPRDAIAGEEPVVFDVAGGDVAPVISFEGDFGSLVRRRIAAGGRLLVVATNTSTWGTSWASAQHVAFSQVRAAENGVWVAHAALSGVSAFVTPEGRVVEDTPLWRATKMVHGARFAEDITPYARLGDWLPLACVAASAAALGDAVLRRRADRVG